MGFLDRILKALGGGGGSGSQRTPGDEYWVYVQCNRCGEPLRARIDMRNETSEADDGAARTVRKGIVGSGKLRCFQTIEVMLSFDQNQQVIDRQINGGRFLTADEYQAAAANWPPPPEEQEEDA